MSAMAPATVREIAKRAATPPLPRARMPVESRRRLRMMELADGRVRLVEASGAVFMLCATRALAERMRAAFAP